MSRPLNKQESKYRDMILNFSMPSAEAGVIFDELVDHLPFYDRLEFIKCLAALCVRYEGEVRRKAAGPNKEIYKILWAACAPDRVEWLFNTMRIRHTISRNHLSFLPSGTSSNEALHAEINSWSRSTNALHRSTLALKLRYFRFIKLLEHYLATRYPMSHVVTATMLLGRSLHESLWLPGTWDEWCQEQQGQGPQAKSALPLVQARQGEAQAVKKWLMKKPSSRRVKSSKKTVKATPLSARRLHTLRSAGVKKT